MQKSTAWNFGSDYARFPTMQRKSSGRNEHKTANEQMLIGLPLKSGNRS
jgi:hypothetical protein